MTCITITTLKKPITDLLSYGQLCFLMLTAILTTVIMCLLFYNVNSLISMTANMVKQLLTLIMSLLSDHESNITYTPT